MLGSYEAPLSVDDKMNTDNLRKKTINSINKVCVGQNNIEDIV